MATLFLPIDTMVRELDARVLMAALWVRAGGDAVIGQHDRVFDVVARTSGGVYLGNKIFRDLPPHDLTRYDVLKERGHTLVHLDEEGAVHTGDQSWWEAGLLGFDPTVLDGDDMIFTWGDFQREHFAARSKHPDRVVTTGHPRFSFYTHRQSYFEDEVAELRARHGTFVLLNTSFVLANNILGHANTFSPTIQGYDTSDPEQRRRWLVQWQAANERISSFVLLAARLVSELPDVTVVVRPHPTEDEELYNLIFAGMDRVVVSKQGAVTPWILACSALVHDGCTTALEAHLAGKRPINYTASLADGGAALPSFVSEMCNTEDEVVGAIKDALGGNGPGPVTEVPPEMLHLMRDLDPGRPDGFETVMATILDMHGNPAAGGSPLPGRLTMAPAAAKDRVLAPAKSLARRFTVPQRERLYRGFRSHFGGFDKRDLDRRVASAARLVGTKARMELIDRNVAFVTGRR